MSSNKISRLPIYILVLQISVITFTKVYYGGQMENKEKKKLTEKWGKHNYENFECKIRRLRVLSVLSYLVFYKINIF